MIFSFFLSQPAVNLPLFCIMACQNGQIPLRPAEIFPFRIHSLKFQSSGIPPAFVFWRVREKKRLSLFPFRSNIDIPYTISCLRGYSSPIRRVSFEWTSFSEIFNRCDCSTFRMTVIAACKMDLRNYPMDKQNCSLLFESCEYISFSFECALIL